MNPRKGAADAIDETRKALDTDANITLLGLIGLTPRAGESEIRISTLHGGSDEFLRVLEAAIATAG